jgi:hypothetical protein
MGKQERDQVLELVAEGAFNVAVYEALPSEHEYKMRLEPLK